MDLLLLFFRFVLMSLICSIPGILMGLAFFGPMGGCCGLGISLLGLCCGSLWSERGVSRAHSIEPNTPQGLDRSLEVAAHSISAILEISEPLPRLLVFADPSPNALAVRSLGGRGTILLSQGLISLLNEDELREVLILCLLRLKQSSIVFQSFCAILAIWALGFAPRPWVNLVFAGKTLSTREEQLLSPVSGVGFLVFFPVARFIFNLGKPVFSFKMQISLRNKYLTTVQKIAQTIHIWSPGKRQAAFFLYLIDPESGKMLFPY